MGVKGRPRGGRGAVGSQAESPSSLPSGCATCYIRKQFNISCQNGAMAQCLQATAVDDDIRHRTATTLNDTTDYEEVHDRTDGDMVEDEELEKAGIVNEIEMETSYEEGGSIDC